MRAVSMPCSFGKLTTEAALQARIAQLKKFRDSRVPLPHTVCPDCLAFLEKYADSDDIVAKAPPAHSATKQQYKKSATLVAKAKPENSSPKRKISKELSTEATPESPYLTFEDYFKIKPIEQSAQSSLPKRALLQQPFSSGFQYHPKRAIQMYHENAKREKAILVAQAKDRLEQLKNDRPALLRAVASLKREIQAEMAAHYGEEGDDGEVDFVDISMGIVLTPPMNDPIPPEKEPRFYKKWQVLPALTKFEWKQLTYFGDPNTFQSSFDYNCKKDPAELTETFRVVLAKGREILEAYIIDMKRLYKTYKYKTMERRVFFAMLAQCQLVLFANDWTGALEMYQKTLDCHPLLFEHQPSAYYGLGIVYLHFKHYKWALQAFQRSLYCYPTGLFAVECKLRMAICYMAAEEWPKAIKLFYLVIDEPNPSKFMPKLVLRYNLALAHENNEDLDIAEKKYNELLPDLEIDTVTYSLLQPDQLVIYTKMRAAILRQIGWIYYKRARKDEANKKDLLAKAQESLNMAVAANPKDGLTYTYLGRVHEMDGSATRFQKIDVAYSDYRMAINVSELMADAFFSLAQVYQSEQQPVDALETMLCCLELNPGQSAAWTNIGELYERNEQFEDALGCYKNALKCSPVAPKPLNARVQMLDEELSRILPSRPSKHSVPFGCDIPSVKEAYNLPVLSEVHERVNESYNKIEMRYQNAFWELWTEKRLMEESSTNSDAQVLRPHELNNLEVEVLSHLRDNEMDLIPAEKEVYEYLHTAELTVQHGIIDTIISLVPHEMPRVTDSMIERMRATGHFFENAECYPFPSVPLIASDTLPKSFSILSDIKVPLDSTAQEILTLAHKRCIKNGSYQPIMDEIAVLPKAPMGPEKPIATKEEVKKALEKGERHPLILKTTVYLVDNQSHCVELQHHVDTNTISCIRGLTSVLQLDLSLFSTRSVCEIAGQQEIEVLTQYNLPPETNCDHASQPTWKCISESHCSTINNYANYQREFFKHTLRNETEKIRKTPASCFQGPSPKKLRAEMVYKRADPPPKVLKSIKFATNIDMSNDNKWKAQISELAKLPAFCRLIAGPNMLSHLGHQIIGMNTVKLYMKVPGARTCAHQENGFVASININVGPGDCEWFAVPYEYWGLMEELCEKHDVDFFKGPYWPIMDDLLDEGVPVHRFTQKAGDMVYVSGGAINWVQATGWCNNISWNVAPLNNQQLTRSLFSYEYYKFRNIRCQVPMQLLCWQLAKNVRFTNQQLFNTCKGVLIRSLAFLKMVNEFVLAAKKKIKPHERTSEDEANFCFSCESEVFSVLFVKDINDTFVVYCVYCAKTQKNFDEFIVIQEFSFADLSSIYNGMRFFSPTGNKVKFVA
ncbi:unnamed protein product [Caenorhabditis sp. 36 PRJEB53466]|nr:unnamed protein product [Caenorhabditis sp. 36 PRJEB53466]